MKLVMRFYNASQAAYSSATKVRGVNVRMALTKCANSMSTNVFCLETIRLNLSVANRIINGHSMSVRSQLSLARRFAHTDVKFPNFENYRRDSTLDINKAARESEDERRAISHAIYYGVGGMMALIAAKESIQGIVAFKGMAADQKALASIEVKMEEIPEGQVAHFLSRG
ncbi:Cytochrome b-c1 complex subunit Rieske, mitochondrial [Toxocara canis]|uniref:Cytochrome b-c1 complex subunit Rieske, mitochondrial n=1 Tax=Toxocara canis TaxID=6265 RepID=A0A0B2W2U5_TOXCA|nr:Cytochrome b-c1 complex subunit Rieske, mitochondrial [Toxocara canis]